MSGLLCAEMRTANAMEIDRHDANPSRASSSSETPSSRNFACGRATRRSRSGFIGISRDARDQKDKVAIRFSGRLPSGASRLAWTTTLVAGSYPLAVRHEGIDTPASDDAFEWLTGTEESRRLQLTRRCYRVQVRRFPALRHDRLHAHRARTASTTSCSCSGCSCSSRSHFRVRQTPHPIAGLPAQFQRVARYGRMRTALATRTRTVLAQVTAFTVAHSITLGLSLYGVVRLPSAIVGADHRALDCLRRVGRCEQAKAEKYNHKPRRERDQQRFR